METGTTGIADGIFRPALEGAAAIRALADQYDARTRALFARMLGKEEKKAARPFPQALFTKETRDD